MREQVPPQPASGVSARQMAYGLLLIAALMTVGILCGGLVLAQVACGCTTPPDLVVINRSSLPASVEWHSASGLLGTPLFRIGGSGEAPACQMSTIGLSRGDMIVDVTVGTERRVVEVTVEGDRAQPSGWLAISAQGKISGTVPGAAPDTPLEGVSLCP